MSIKTILANGALALLLAAGVISSAGCKKQPKCGCNGDALDSLAQSHVLIHYDATSESAQFTPLGNPYYIFYFCNPDEYMGELTKFNQGDEILVSGEYFYECSYLMNSGNSSSSYYNMYRVYQIKVTAVAAYDYGK
jgi:hypothetical protein